ncbi:MAG TPA: signal recognition particle-docking protein FtsY [Polyangiaceae bacterium]
MELYVVIGILLVVAVYFLFLRKGAPEQLPSRSERAPGPSPSEKKKSEPPPPPKRAAAEVLADESARPAPSPSVRPPTAPSAPPPPVVVSAPPPGERQVAVETLRRGLAKSRSDEGFFGRLKALLGSKKTLDGALATELEEVLLASDVGVETSNLLLERVRQGLEKGDLADPEKVWDALREQAVAVLSVGGRSGGITPVAKPTVVLFIGVNGAGKTTSIGKLATKLTSQGHKVVLAAGDTFRAAAVQQLVVWGQRVGCEVVRGKDGADPGSVVFDAIKKAQETGADVVLADTAGRLHTKQNLMAEMKKIAKTAEKALPEAPHEVLLVMDATTGQNALAQAREFKEALPITGIVLTKLDGTAKGGVVLGIASRLALPVRLVGLGERPEDLREFSPSEFVEALLGREETR